VALKITFNSTVNAQAIPFLQHVKVTEIWMIKALKSIRKFCIVYLKWPKLELTMVHYVSFFNWHRQNNYFAIASSNCIG